MFHKINPHGIHFPPIGAAGPYSDVVLHDYRRGGKGNKGGAS